jgi:hypothetical protein
MGAAFGAVGFSMFLFKLHMRPAGWAAIPIRKLAHFIGLF